MLHTRYRRLLQVRSTTVKGLIDLVHKDPTVLTKALLEAVGQRMKDKKVREALVEYFEIPLKC